MYSILKQHFRKQLNKLFVYWPALRPKKKSIAVQPQAEFNVKNNLSVRIFLCDLLKNLHEKILTEAKCLTASERISES